MKLNEKEIETLRKWKYSDKEIAQISLAAEVTRYERLKREFPEKKAKELLGTNIWLSGLARSAFHATAARIDKHGIPIYFDSCSMWK